MGSVYPNDIDTDLEIERVDNNITEIGGDVINSLRDAVFMIERALGITPQGNKNSLSERIDVSIDADGRIKSDAIDDLGLVSLPISNSQVGDNAGIEESKLDLDFTTQSLKNSIESLATDIGGLQNGIAVLNNSLSLHFLGSGHFHDGYDIKINSIGADQIGLAGLEATTVGDALVELVQLLISGDDEAITPHIDLELPSEIKHRASEIFVDTSEFEIIDRTATNVQDALLSIDTKQGAFGERHLDTFHANGILREIKSGELFNSNQKILGPVDGANYSEETSIITIPGISSFSDLNVSPGDIIEIVSDVLDIGSYQIRAIGPLSSSETLGNFPSLNANQLAVFHIFTETIIESDEVIINIYKPSSTSSELAPLACSIRNNETIVDSIIVLNPDAARVVSVGLNGNIINGDGYEVAIRAGIGNGQFREITIPNLNKERLNTNQARPVDAESVAERINAYVSDPSLGFHFPISAYKVGNELAIAHNLVGEEFTIEILDGYSANFALGLDGYGANVINQIITGNTNNSFVINGIETSTIKTLFSGHATINSTTDTFSLLDDDNNIINPLDLGIVSGSVIHITDHEDLETNGSYTLLTANSTTVSVFASESIVATSAPTTFDVKITSSNISLEVLESLETDKGLAQVFINSSGEIFVHQRLMYGTNLGSAIEIIGVSDTFPVGEVNLSISLDGNLALFNVISESFAGKTSTIDKNFKGVLKVFHSNNLDYLLIKTKDGNISGGFEAVAINSPLPADEILQLCVFHFDGSLDITNIVDKRLFGNLSSSQVRDDLIEELNQRPIQELRSGGIISGFDVLEIPFVDTITNMQALPVQGGIAYVNGVRVAVETQKVLIQSYDEESSLITGNKIVGINEFGSIQVFNNELGELLTDGYSSSAVFGKILPLYQVSLINGDITDYIDLRLFINNLDNKLELIVDETNNVVGNFRNLEGALLYASSYPNKEHLTIKIINSVFPTRQISVPDGISIIGSSPWGGDEKHQIVNTNNLGTSFVVLEGNNRLENIEIISEVAAMNGALIEVIGSNVNIEKCLIGFEENVSSTDEDIGILISTGASKNVKIINNKLDQVYSGIVSLNGCDELVIEKNTIINLNGTGGISNGIKVGSLTRLVSNISIKNNIIKVPSVVIPADIRGISVDIGQNIGNIRVVENSIIHEAENTMTNGIRIENEQSTGGIVSNLFLSNNLVSGIKLDDNDVWGIFISDVELAKVNGNIVENVGVSSGNSDVGCIGIASNVDFAELSTNTLKNCDTTRGIEITSGGRVNIANNILDTLGASCYYISGNAPHSSISNNTLVGPGSYGVRWTGTNSKISDNNLSQPADLSNYAFENYAIFVQTSDVDITNNTINGMVFDQESVGISNVSTGRDRIKVIGNTIVGTKMSSGIELFGTGHVLSNNRIFNDQVALTNITSLISLNQVENSLIMGNVLQGDAYSGIHADVSLTNTTISNNVFDPTQGTAQNMSYALNIELAANCFIAGNKLPQFGQGITFDSVIGSGTALNYSNNFNTISTNAGLKDVISLSFLNATTSYDSSSDTHHWVMYDNADYWELFSIASLTRNLYFPIQGLAQGSQLLSVQPHGTCVAGTLTVQAFKKRRSTLASESISSSDTISTTPFGIPGSADGLVNTTSNNANGEVINNYDFNYYVKITHTGGALNTNDVRIHGVNVIFRY